MSSVQFQAVMAFFVGNNAGDRKKKKKIKARFETLPSKMLASLPPGRASKPPLGSNEVPTLYNFYPQQEEDLGSHILMPCLVEHSPWLQARMVWFPPWGLRLVSCGDRSPLGCVYSC